MTLSRPPLLTAVYSSATLVFSDDVTTCLVDVKKEKL